MTECEVLLNSIQCEQEYAKTKCHACGRPACKGCSALIARHGHRARVCNDCQEDDRKDKIRLAIS
jgi:hypothetical protein